MTITKKHEQSLSYIHDYGIDIFNREVYLHSIGTSDDDEGGVDFKAAVTLQKNLRFLDSISFDPIIIHMHIPGGNWCDCVAMYESIKSCGSPIGIVVYSRAESCGSVIIQAADLRIMVPSSYMLIHYGSTSIDGDHKVAMSNLEWSQKEANKMIDIFNDKIMLSTLVANKKWSKVNARKHIISQLDNKADWILYPQEVVDYGFADGVLGSKEYPDISTMKQHLTKMY